MTNPVTGDSLSAPYIMPSRTAVAEHLVTLPMALATMLWVCGILLRAQVFPPNSIPTHLLEEICSPVNGLAFLIAQLAQMWHSQNIRAKVATANGTNEDTKS